MSYPFLRSVQNVARAARNSVRCSMQLFPPFVFAHAVETEGLAKVAQAAGYSVFGMPGLHVEHK